MNLLRSVVIASVGKTEKANIKIKHRASSAELGIILKVIYEYEASAGARDGLEHAIEAKAQIF